MNNLNTLCLRCQGKISATLLQNSRSIQINQQTFQTLQCPHCQQPTYTWKTKNQTFTNFHKVHVVLYEPEIVGNVGTILRLGVAFNFVIHIIEPLGFIFSKKWLNRSSTNHFELAKYHLYSSWKDFMQKNQPKTLVLTTSKAKKPLHEFSFLKINEPIYLVFGCESKGLPQDLLKKHSEYLVKIHHSSLVSSINLANAVAIFINELYNQYYYENFSFLC